MISIFTFTETLWIHYFFTAVRYEIRISERDAAKPWISTCPPSPILIRTWTRINEVLSWRGAMIKNLAVDQINICITKFKFPSLITDFTFARRKWNDLSLEAQLSILKSFQFGCVPNMDRGVVKKGAILFSMDFFLPRNIVLVVMLCKVWGRMALNLQVAWREGDYSETKTDNF